MNDNLLRRSILLERYRMVFAIFSGLAAISLAVALIAVVVMLAGDRTLLEPVFIDDDVLSPVGELQLFDLGLLLAGCFLIPVVILWLLWLFTASRFARKAGAQGMRYPAWVAVVSHFFPIVNLYMPLLALVEVEAATRDPNDWESLAASWLVVPTWLVAKCAAFAVVFILALRGGAETAAQYVDYLVATFIASLICIVGLLLAYLFMRRMHRLQESLAKAALSLPTPDQT